MEDCEVTPRTATPGAGGEDKKETFYRILIVDDDPFVRKLNTDTLSRPGYQVDTAEDGIVAWEKLQMNSYDLVITDNSMPNMTGLELLQCIYSDGLSISVIMATGTYPEEEFALNPWLKPRAALIKPYTPASLLKAIQEVLGRAGD